MTADTVTHRFEETGARVLTVGVWASAFLSLLGLVLSSSGWQPWADYLLHSGLLILMATPAARILVLFGEYCHTRDWFSIVTTLGVIAVLVFTLVSAFRAAG